MHQQTSQVEDPFRIIPLCESQAPRSITCLEDGLKVTSKPPSSSEIPQLSGRVPELLSPTPVSYFAFITQAQLVSLEKEVGVF